MTQSLPRHVAAAAIAQLERGSGVPGMGPPPVRTHPTDGTAQKVLHPDYSLFEKMGRILPDQSWFSVNVTSSSPVQFDIESFQVPRNMDLWLFDYEFSVFRQSGYDPYDAIKADDDRFSGVMGFDLQFGINKRQGNLRYQIDPIAPPSQRAAFKTRGGAVPSGFDSAKSSSFGALSTSGTSLLPVRPNVQGPRNGVFTYIVKQDEIVVSSCTIFRRIMNPVAWVQATFSGYLIHQNVSRELLERIKPI